MESDPCWIRAGLCLVSEPGACGHRPQAFLTGLTVKARESASPSLAVSRGIRQPLERGSLGAEGLYIGELNKHRFDLCVARLPGIKVTSMLLGVLLHWLAWLTN